MTEQQIYKWWWDQTRKRNRKAARKSYESDEPSENEEMIVSFQDEFGGYSSRLRIKGHQEKDDADVEQNLCELLGIDVEALALKLAMGINPWDEKEANEELKSAEKTDNLRT